MAECLHLVFLNLTPESETNNAKGSGIVLIVHTVCPPRARAPRSPVNEAADPQVIEENGGRQGIRTPGLLVAKVI